MKLKIIRKVDQGYEEQTISGFIVLSEKEDRYSLIFTKDAIELGITDKNPITLYKKDLLLLQDLTFMSEV